MDIPNLKRVTIGSAQELTHWLCKETGQVDSVMVVTQTRRDHPKYVSREEVGDASVAQGWTPGPRFTLNATLLGHVIHRA